jgi:hypothetical protein
MGLPSGPQVTRFFSHQWFLMFNWFRKVITHPAKVDFAREFFRACNVYCQPDMDQVIVATVYNHGGLTAEKPGGTSAVSFSDPAKLHEAVVAALQACEYTTIFNYSKMKRSDWPAYQASGYKTIKRFEAEFIRLRIKGVNEKNFFYEVTTPAFGDLGLHLTVTVNGHGGDYGEAVHYIVRNYLACKAVAGS